MIFEVI